MASLTDIKRRLWLRADLAAFRRGFKFAPSCKPHVTSFIDEGVAKLSIDDASNDEIRLQLAEAGVVNLVVEVPT